MRTMCKIEFDGVVLTWVQNVKYLGTFLASDLSENIEIRNKQRDVISRTNCVMFKFAYAHKGVLIMLLNSNCSHFFRNKAWDLLHVAVEYFGITWNKAML